MEQQLLQPEQDLFHSPELSAQSLFPLLVLRQLPGTPKRVQSPLTVHGSHNLSQNQFGFWLNFCDAATLSDVRAVGEVARK